VDKYAGFSRWPASSRSSRNHTLRPTPPRPSLARHVRNHSRTAASSHNRAKPPSKQPAGQTATFRRLSGTPQTAPLSVEEKLGSPIAGRQPCPPSSTGLHERIGQRLTISLRSRHNKPWHADSGGRKLSPSPPHHPCSQRRQAFLPLIRASVPVPGSSSQNRTLTPAGIPLSLFASLGAGAGFTTPGAAPQACFSSAQSTSFSVFRSSASGPAMGSGLSHNKTHATHSPSTIALAGTGVVPVAHSVACRGRRPTASFGYRPTSVGSAIWRPVILLTSALCSHCFVGQQRASANLLLRSSPPRRATNKKAPTRRSFRHPPPIANWPPLPASTPLLTALVGISGGPT